MTQLLIFILCRWQQSDGNSNSSFKSALSIKRSLVKDIWIISGFFMLANPIPAVIVFTTLFTTFICLSLIDETQ